MFCFGLKSLDLGKLSYLFHGLTEVISYNFLLSALLLNTIAPKAYKYITLWVSIYFLAIFYYF